MLRHSYALLSNLCSGTSNTWKKKTVTLVRGLDQHLVLEAQDCAWLKHRDCLLSLNERTGSLDLRFQNLGYLQLVRRGDIVRSKESDGFTTVGICKI